MYIVRNSKYYNSKSRNPAILREDDLIHQPSFFPTSGKENRLKAEHLPMSRVGFEPRNQELTETRFKHQQPSSMRFNQHKVSHPKCAYRCSIAKYLLRIEVILVDSVILYRTTRSHIPEDCTLKVFCCCSIIAMDNHLCRHPRCLGDVASQASLMGYSCWRRGAAGGWRRVAHWPRGTG